MLSDLLQKEKTKYKMKGTGGNLEVMRFIALIMMMVLWVYMYIKTSQIVLSICTIYHMSNIPQQSS